MISVPNRQQRLNGSKIICCLILMIAISSCGVFNKNRTKDNEGEKIGLTDPESNLDTLDLTEIPNAEFPPIKKDPVVIPEKANYDAFKKSEYNIGMLIPFNASEFQMGTDQDLSDLKFVNYYAGVKLALGELENMDAGLRVNVSDSERSESVIESKLSSGSLANSDIIIGPYNRDGLKATAEYGKSKKVAIISPWLASSKIADDNPYYLQLRPSLTSHFFKMIEHATANFQADEIVLMGREIASDKNRFRYFQRTYAALKNSGGSQPVEEYFVSEDSLSYGETAFDNLFDEGGKKAIILPNWNYNDEDFLYAVLRRLNTERKNTEITIYGMPIIYDSEKMEFDFYRNLNIRVCLSEFVDWDDARVKRFMSKYFDQYGDLPTSDAFEGYDMMTFIGNNLIKYGMNFHLHLEEDNYRYLQTTYDIQRVFDPEDEKFEKVQYLENKHLDLIQYVGNKFVKID